MRFKSQVVDGHQVFAVSGTNTISFAIQSTEAAKRGLLGFAIERSSQDEPYKPIPGFKVFQSVIPNPDPDTQVSTWDHPMQSFVWDDFTGQPNREYEYRFHPLRGTPTNLDHRAAPIPIKVKTEELFSAGEHDVFFNRGVASSQAYRRKFGNKRPSQLPPEKAKEALQWLTRELDDAILRFIRQAGRGDSLLCCFYEFTYEPVVAALKDAIDKGVDVRIIIDAKVNEYTDSKGVFHPSFPRTDNLAAIKNAGIPLANVIKREANANEIQHNKFMVLLRGKEKLPAEVFSGSTNISLGGITGQTNVGHWIRNPEVADRFKSYWGLLATDPGSRKTHTRPVSAKRRKDYRLKVAAIAEAPDDIATIASGVTSVFSPRPTVDVLELYVKLVDSAKSTSCVTLAFGVNDLFKQYLQDNTSNNHVVFMLLEKKDQPNKRSKKPFVVINASNNVYKAWGAYIRDPIYQWARETNNRLLKFNSHVSYIHSKFLLMDPLSEDPIVVTGSANFSAASTTDNDENMLIIRGNRRVADIYFTEFNRLFNHYYFRAVQEARSGLDTDNETKASLFLDETGKEWQKKYEPGKFRAKRLSIYTGMKGITTL